MFKKFFLVVVMLLFLVSCSSNFVKIGNHSFSVEIAKTIPELQKGLMFRESLDKNKGMLFVMPVEGVQSFWMKNTLIPLDMIFISGDGMIQEIREASPCQADPCSTFKGYGKYVLEINRGLSKKFGFKVGQKVVMN